MMKEKKITITSKDIKPETILVIYYLELKSHEKSNGTSHAKLEIQAPGIKRILDLGYNKIMILKHKTNG